METISRIRAANERLLKELGGLDGDSLRNSCFVEQQSWVGSRPSPVPNASRPSISLGLARLTVWPALPYTRDQERELQLAERRRDLAQTQAEAARLSGRW